MSQLENFPILAQQEIYSLIQVRLQAIAPQMHYKLNIPQLAEKIKSAELTINETEVFCLFLAEASRRYKWYQTKADHQHVYNQAARIHPEIYKEISRILFSGDWPVHTEGQFRKREHHIQSVYDLVKYERATDSFEVAAETYLQNSFSYDDTLDALLNEADSYNDY